MSEPTAPLSSLPDAVTLSDVEAAAQRIACAVRRTPVLNAICAQAPAADVDLWLKLELLQVTGSFKARGAIHKLRCLPKEALARGIVTASSGNHGLAVAYAGWLAGVKASIYLPEVVPPAKLAKLRRWGAQVELCGQVWDDSNAAALARVERDGLTYIHPFADTTVIAGQGTLALEFLEDAPPLDTLLVAIGGGGLIAGVAVAAKARCPGLCVVGVEPVGAPTLYESRRAGRVIQLERIATAAGTLAPRQSDALNLALIERYVDDIVLVSDDDMREAARWLWFETSVAAELSGAAALAALRTGQYRARPGERVGVVVCGAGTDGI